MCLDIVVKKRVRKRYFWKVFTLGLRNRLLSDCKGVRKRAIPYGVWINEKDRRGYKNRKHNFIYSLRSEKLYKTGFHGFHLKSDAEDWKGYGQIVCLVEVRRIVATGHQEMFGRRRVPVSVFKEMRVLPPEEQKKKERRIH